MTTYALFEGRKTRQIVYQILSDPYTLQPSPDTFTLPLLIGIFDNLDEAKRRMKELYTVCMTEFDIAYIVGTILFRDANIEVNKRMLDYGVVNDAKRIANMDARIRNDVFKTMERNYYRALNACRNSLEMKHMFIDEFVRSGYHEINEHCDDLYGYVNGKVLVIGDFYDRKQPNANCIDGRKYWCICEVTAH